MNVSAIVTSSASLSDRFVAPSARCRLSIRNGETSRMAMHNRHNSYCNITLTVIPGMQNVELHSLFAPQRARQRSRC